LPIIARTIMSRFALTVGAAALVSSLTLASAAWAVDVHDAWARASAGMARAGAAFLTIVNHGGADDRLIAASAPVSAVTELHTHIMDGEVMRMRQVADIPVPAGETVRLQPGGLHIMFMQLEEPLTEGQTFPLTLTFEAAGDMVVPVTVAGPGAMGAKGPQGAMQGHGAMGGMTGMGGQP
jgi:copper(I)-binding protein